MSKAADPDPHLRRPLMLARQAGLAEGATRLEERVLGPHTTSSEWLGEVAMSATSQEISARSQGPPSWTPPS
jgi:hypothetical protein